MDDVLKRLHITALSIKAGHTASSAAVAGAIAAEEIKILRCQVSAANVLIARLRLLLAHAVEKADGWHDDSWGGPIKGDALMDEARAFVGPNV